MKKSSTSIKASKQNNIMLVILDRFNSGFEMTDNITIAPFTKDDNVSKIKNSFLRLFYDNEKVEYCAFWKPEKKQNKADLEKIVTLNKSYISAIENTNIPYFTGTLKGVLKVDYKGQNIVIGTGLGQKITLEVISKKAIEEVGYFDVRLKDYSSAIDYAYRLADKGLMPKVDYKRTPWLFDIDTDLPIIAKPEMDEYSSQWYLYKHEQLPWDQDAGEVSVLREELIKIKG